MVVLTKTQEGALEADFAQDGQDCKKYIREAAQVQS